MVPNTLITPHQSVNLLNSANNNLNLNNLMDSNTLNIPKRKRGRPPKPNNFSNKITKTINISINTPPLSNSPNAENNSNQTVKRGIPDIFTPTMRVSPTSNYYNGHSRNGSMSGSKRKKSKKNSISSIDSISPIKRKDSFTSNQSSPINDYVNSKTLDNISMITNNSNAIPNPYNSPPPTVKQASKRSKNLLPPVSIIPEFEKSISPTAVNEIKDNGPGVTSRGHSVSSSGNTSSPVTAPNSASVGETSMPSYDFNLKLMIDDLGKAVLSNHERQQTPHEQHGQQAQAYPTHPQSQPHPHNHQIPDDLTPTRPRHHSHTGYEDYEKPKLYHSNSVIGIESKYLESQSQSSSISDFDYGQVPNQDQSRSMPTNQAQRPVPVKYNSDFNYSEANPPQTPKPKENYLLSTGLTPYYGNSNNTGNSINLMTHNGNPLFSNPNLTPQFNSLMNSIVNSPKKFNNNQFMLNQEMFMNNNFNGMNYNNTGGASNNNGANPEFYSPGGGAQVPLNQPQPLPQQQQQPQGQTAGQQFPQQYNNGQGNGMPVNMGQYNQFNQATSIPLQLQPQFSHQLQNQHHQPFQYSDDSDARSALKKMIHVKRK